jgi:histidine triad (HIT) family protein
MSYALPVKRIKQTEALLVFHHPSPEYDIHILLVPKKAIADLNALTDLDDQLILEVFRTVKLLVEEFDLTDYRLIVNAGDYQKVPQLHFHLVSDT